MLPARAGVERSTGIPEVELEGKAAPNQGKMDVGEWREGYENEATSCWAGVQWVKG